MLFLKGLSVSIAGEDQAGVMEYTDDRRGFKAVVDYSHSVEPLLANSSVSEEPEQQRTPPPS